MGLFREYDLRGIVGDELTEEIAERVGRAYSTHVRNRRVKTISVGRDGRLSSPLLHKALIRGLLAGGGHPGGSLSLLRGQGLVSLLVSPGRL